MSTQSRSSLSDELRANEIAARLDDALAFGPKGRSELLREVQAKVETDVTPEDIERARLQIGATLGSQMIWPAK